MRKTPERVDREVGVRLQRRRKALAISQAVLARGLVITFQQIQKYEKGTNRISASRLNEIAIILDVPVSYFFDGLLVAQARPVDGLLSEISEFAASPDGHALVQSFSRIANSTTRRRVVLLVETLAEIEASNGREVEV